MHGFSRRAHADEPISIGPLETRLFEFADNLPTARQYALSAAAAVATVLLGAALSLLEDFLPLVVVMPVAAFIVMLFGLRAGLVVLFVGGLGTQFMLPPAYSFVLPPGAIGAMLTYYVCGFVVCIITNRLHRVRLSLKVSLLNAQRAARERDAAMLLKQRASEELERMMDVAPVALVVAHDPSCAVIVGNRVSEDLLEVPRATNSSVQGPDAERLPFRAVDDNRIDIPARMLPVQRAAGGEVVRGEEMSLLFSDGRLKRVSANAAPIRDKDGTIVGSVAALIDVTARFEAENALIAAKHQAESANEAKSRFLAAASHDLRQPLQALNLYLDVLAAKVGEGERPVIEHLERCSNSLNELLTDLLDLSKLDAGVVTPQCTSFAVNDVFRAVLAAHAGPAAHKALKLRAVPTRLRTCTDRALFERVLGNLVANAVRYTHRGGVVFGCRRRHGAVWIEVWDSGIGIPRDKTEEIFEEFRQLGNPERSREKGTGLGLAIVKKTLELLGLRIDVRSRLGRGSVFAVEVPRCDKAIPKAVGESTAAAVPMRILVIEDDANVREAVAFALEQDGHQVIAAADMAELPLAEMAPPDVVVADFRLTGGRTGIDAVSAARAAFGPLPAIILTGETHPGTVEDIAAAGVRALHKPITYRALRACLAEVAGR